MSTSSYDEPFQLVLSIVAAPAPEGCKGVSYVKWGTEDIGWVRKVAPDDAHQQNPALGAGLPDAFGRGVGLVGQRRAPGPDRDR